MKKDKITHDRLRTELTDACAARDALARECNHLEADREYNASLVVKKDRELIRMRDAAQKQGAELAQTNSLLAESDEENARLAGIYQGDADAICEALGVAWDGGNEYPTVALSEIKRSAGLRGANRALVQDVAEVTENRNYWYGKVTDAEAERDKWRKEAQEQSDEVQRDEVQCDWLSPVEAEGLRQQLAKAQIQAATPKKAAVQLWGFWNGNTLIAKPSYEDAIHEAWDKLLIAVDSIAGDILLERLATLDTAEEALAGCGIGGIYDEFNGLADAIQQMSEHIKDLEDDQSAHVHSKAADELAQTLETERQLRQEAERRADCAEALATLVNEETAELLRYLAEGIDCIAPNEPNSPPTRTDEAYALAARIREALEVTE